MQFVEFVTATLCPTSVKAKRGPLNCGNLHSQWYMLNPTHWALNTNDDLKNLEKSKENLFFFDKVNSKALTHSSLIRELKIHSWILLPFWVLHEATFPLSLALELFCCSILISIFSF